MSVEEVQEVYQILQRHEVKDLDTAHIYVRPTHTKRLHHLTDMITW
jgi:aryl-alcohol dehydrogenase-like predicted oxidoreductase